MISIRDSIADIEKMHQHRAAAVEAYLSTIRNIAQYAIEFEEGSTEPFKKYINDVAAEVATGDGSAISGSKATMRGLLRDYRDKAAQYLSGLRGDLSSTTGALQEIMETLSQSDGDHEVRLRAALARLRDACKGTEVESIRKVVSIVSDHIEESLEQLHKQHQVTIAQFHMEVRVLHKRIDSLETAASIDSLSMLLKRGELEVRLTNAPPGSSLLLIKVSGVRLAESNFLPEVAAELTAAFTRRLRNTLPPAADLGRWSHEEFVAVLPVPKPEAIAMAKWIAEHLSGHYSCLQEGKAVRPSLQLSVGVVEHRGEPTAQILAKIGEFLRGDPTAPTSAKADPHR